MSEPYIERKLSITHGVIGLLFMVFSAGSTFAYMKSAQTVLEDKLSKQQTLSTEFAIDISSLKENQALLKAKIVVVDGVFTDILQTYGVEMGNIADAIGGLKTQMAVMNTKLDDISRRTNKLEGDK